MPPGCFPMGKQRRRNAPTMQFQTFANEIRRYNVKTWCICNIGTPIRPIWFCSKICYVGGRIISAPTQTVPPNDRAEIPVGVGVVLRAANQNPMIAGGDHTIIQRILSARLFPQWGNNVGALRRQWHHQTFANEIRRCRGQVGGNPAAQPPLAPPMGELARLKAVTERVPCSNHGTFHIFATACALSGSLIARQLSQRESQGAGYARPAQGVRRRKSDGAAALGSPYGGAGTAQAVTERV